MRVSAQERQKRAWRRMVGVIGSGSRRARARRYEEIAV